MKIDEVSVSGCYQGRKAARGPDKCGGSFSDLLAQKVDQEEKPAPASAPPKVELGQPDIAPSPLYNGVNDMLDALERYSQALGDPQLSLKDIEPLANGLEEQARRLDRLMNEHQAGSLNELAAQATTQARVEVMKFRRGDYV